MILGQPHEGDQQKQETGNEVLVKTLRISRTKMTRRNIEQAGGKGQSK